MAIQGQQQPRYAKEIGVEKRAIHNSINASIGAEEIKALKDSKLTSAIILAFNATNPSVEGKLEILEKGGTGQTKGMLDVAKEVGSQDLLWMSQLLLLEQAPEQR